MTEVTDLRTNALAAISVNVRRLLHDARVLQLSGSAGSALALAILAFEEAGKAHIVRHSWQKPKRVSSHVFRHFMAFTVLHASFLQKYGLDVSGVNGKVFSHFEAAGFKPGSKEPIPPPTAQLRQDLREILQPQLALLSDEQKLILAIEQRWLAKIGAAVQGGALEKIRQSGLYLDTDNYLAVTSSPVAIEVIDSERWIWAATRVLNLLEPGDFTSSYSPLAQLVDTAAAGDTSVQRELEEVRTRSGRRSTSHTSGDS